MSVSFLRGSGRRGAARRAVAALACLATVSMTMASCASWDVPANESIQQLEHELASGELIDQSTATGVAHVGDISEIVPVAEDPSPQLPVSLTDADGHAVEVTDTSRILALDLYGTYTTTLIGLGLGDKIVGRTVSSTEPSLADLPVVTAGGHSINVEAVLSLQPTLVIVDHSIGPREAIDQIRAAGVTTVVMSPERQIDSIGTDIDNLAGVVGLPDEGEKLAERSRDELAAAQETIAGLTPENPLRMAFLYARGTGGVFYILGADDGTSGLISSLGGVDAAAEAGVGSATPASAEALVDLDPEVFVMMNKGLESTGDIAGLLNRPGIAQTQAGQRQRVLALPDSASLAFGPQTGELLLRAAKSLYLGGSH